MLSPTFDSRIAIRATVGAGYSATDTTIALSAGHGARIRPTPSLAVWWDSTNYSFPQDDPKAEIVNVVSVSTDTLVIERAQKGTRASSKNTNGATYVLSTEALFDVIGDILPDENDYGSVGIKTDKVAESTSSAGITLSNNTVAAANKTIDTTTADTLKAGGVIVPQELIITVPILPAATITARNLFVARVAYQITGIDFVPNLVEGGALTATVVKATSTATPAKTTTPMHTADAINMNTTAHTIQPITLTTTAADLRLAAGDRIAFCTSAAVTTGSGVVSIRLKRI